ncbi:caspase domain-containing protein [Mycena crocata]|nr:caspase domain-containing protein [Mycena crocata]
MTALVCLAVVRLPPVLLFSTPLERLGNPSRKNAVEKETAHGLVEHCYTVLSWMRYDVSGSLVNLGLTQFTLPRHPRKRAFLIGNKVCDPDPPPSSHEDIWRFRTLLIEKFDFEPGNITVMIDDGVGEQPTRANIMTKLKRLLLGQQSGDLFVFAYAGHGTQKECIDGSEEDGLDEAIITCDDPNDGSVIILDDVFHDYLVKPLAPGCRLVTWSIICVIRWAGRTEEHTCTSPPSRPPTQGAGRDPEIVAVCFSACKDAETIFAKRGCSMLNEIICVLGDSLTQWDFAESEPCPTLKLLMKAVNKKATCIYHDANWHCHTEDRKRRNDLRDKRKQMGNNTNENEWKDVQPTYKVGRWAPQISSPIPLYLSGNVPLVYIISIFQCPPADNLETQMATNHIGSFLFIKLLAAKFLATGTAHYTPRVVLVSSVGHEMCEGINFTVSLRQQTSLLASSSPSDQGDESTGTVCTQEGCTRYARVLGPDGQPHPEVPFKTLQQGAATTVAAAFDPSLNDKPGSYLDDYKAANELVHPACSDATNGEKLWTLSEKIIGETFVL